MKRHIGPKAFILAGMMAIFLSGCSLWGSNDESASIDPPPDQMNVMADQWMGLEGELDATIAGTAESEVDSTNVTTMITVYVEDMDGYVVPMEVEVPGVEGIAKETLKYMVRGGPVQSQLPTGFTPLLPEGTEVLGMDIKPNKLAIVDFSETFQDYDGDAERKMIESIVWTLTGFDSIDKVQIWVNGRALKEMPVHGTPIAETLSRSMGINLEHTSHTPFTRSSPVTVYFQKSSTDLSSYFVPVTRIVDYTSDVALESMEQLIKGPSYTTTLTPVIEPIVEVTNVDQSDDLITVYFSKDLLEQYDHVPAPFLQSVVLSLTENTGASKVQVHVDGHAQVISTDEQNYSEPVSRPVTINASGI